MATANLKVEIKSELPRFVTDMDDRQIVEGNNVKFTAKIEGYPKPIIQWTLNEEPITALYFFLYYIYKNKFFKNYRNTKICELPDNVYTLEFTDVQLNQTGKISCQASNNVGLKKQNAQLLVKEASNAPIFLQNLKDCLVEEKETITMETQLAAIKPVPTVQWFKDGQPLLSNDHYTLKEESNGIYKLVIVSAEFSDKSRITVKAENKFGSAGLFYLKFFFYFK